jgi:nicotinamidase-related amidase
MCSGVEAAYNPEGAASTVSNPGACKHDDAGKESLVSDSFFGPERGLGAPDLRLPDSLREPVRDHLVSLRAKYVERSWARHVGFGERPAVLVIDLALFWTRPDTQMGSNLDTVVGATRAVLDAARVADVPIFFTSLDFDRDEPGHSLHGKVNLKIPDDDAVLDIDPRLARRPTEPIILKRTASAFRNTDLEVTLDAMGVDTVIVTGVSTSHCVAATCRDATSRYRVIVPREAVGDRSEIMNLVYLLDFDIDIGDVLPLSDVIDYLNGLGGASARQQTRSR